MANYVCVSRTNYFKVTDPDKLRDLVAKLDDAALWEREDGSFAFGSYNSLIYCCDEELNEVNIVSELQAILPDDEAIIITEVGNAKLRYLVGWCTIITKDAQYDINVQEIAKDKARELLKVTAKKFDMEY